MGAEIIKIRKTNFDKCLEHLRQCEDNGELYDIVLCYRHKAHEGEDAAAGLSFYFSSQEETSVYCLGIAQRLVHIINDYIEEENGKVIDG